MTPSSPAIEKRFFFHADAVALAARIRRGAEFPVPSVASSCLAITGGLGTAHAAASNFHDIIAFDEASTHVSGDFVSPAKAIEFTNGNHGENDLPAVTVVEGRITGLRITVGGRVVRVRDMHARQESFADRVTPARFHSLTTSIQGLSVDGVDVAVAPHTDFFNRHDTLEKLRRGFEDPEFCAAHQDYFFISEPTSEEHYGQRRLPRIVSNGIAFGTVNSLLWAGEAPKGARITRNRITIENFGSIYLGEIIIQEGLRRVTLLRFQLGSPYGGEGVAMDLQSNGTGWPPQVTTES